MKAVNAQIRKDTSKDSNQQLKILGDLFPYFASLLGTNIRQKILPLYRSLQLEENAAEEENQRIRLNLDNGRLAGPVLLQLPPNSRFEDCAAKVYVQTNK